MNTNRSGLREIEEREEVVAEPGPRPMNRRERERVVRDDDFVEHERVVEDAGVERSLWVGKITGFIWLLTGLLEVLILLRFALKLIGANAQAPFVALIYSVSSLFLWPFAGMTATPAANGMVLEISSIFAMVVYGIVGWVIVALVRLLLTPSESRSVSVERRERL